MIQPPGTTIHHAVGFIPQLRRRRPYYPMLARVALDFVFNSIPTALPSNNPFISIMPQAREAHG